MSGWGRHGTNKSNLEEFPGPLTEPDNFLKFQLIFLQFGRSVCEAIFLLVCFMDALAEGRIVFA